MQSGKCIAIQVRKETNVVNQLRALIGPLDPEKARISDKFSLRAKFGKDLSQNVFFCTDLESDGIAHCQLIFSSSG